MENYNILPQTIYKFYCDQKILDKSLEHIKNIDYKDMEFNSCSKDRMINNHRELNELHNWFQSCVNEVTHDLNFKDQLTITQSWSTRSTSGQWHHPHIHQYSIISGVFYLTDSNAETCFSIPSIWELPNIFCHSIDRDNTKIDHRNKTEKGCLIIFPSSLPHYVNEHYDSDPRYIVSFNTFFNGSMGNLNNFAGANLKIIKHELYS